MRGIYFFFLICLLIFECQKKWQENKPKPLNCEIDSASISNSTTFKSKFYSIGNIDSIVENNFVFTDSIIDSIGINTCEFEAIYLSAWKGVAHLLRYKLLKMLYPEEYKKMFNIHTSHLVVIDGKEFLFNGKGEVRSPKEIPESTDVVIKASVYSFYSKRVCLGRYIILDSIKLKTRVLDRYKSFNGSKKE